MPPKERDAALLWDMLQAAREVLVFAQGATLEQFSSQKLLRYAVERQLMVIGEAARRVSTTFKDEHPSVPWSAIVGQRNVLAHDYGEILVDRVWLVVTQELPDLVRELSQLVPPPPEADTA